MLSGWSNRARRSTRIDVFIQMWVGMTCWRRSRDWNEAGVWERLHQVLLDELQDAGATIASNSARPRCSRTPPHEACVPNSAPLGWWRVLGLLQTLLACWHGTCPVCRRELPPEHPLRGPPT